MSNSEWRRQPNTEEKRPDYSRKASAPYRFVPYDASAIALAQREIRGSEGTGRPDIATPLAEGLSARIKVHWIAETPLLIGVQENDSSPVMPMRFGNSGGARYIIPGATIRGAIRAVAEIAAAARLSQVNRNATKFKVSHGWTLEQVLRNSGVDEVSGPYASNRLDMVEALFGFVREKANADATPPDQLALRGRVAFSAALLSKGQDAAPSEQIPTVMVGPKPSFAPFYLAANEFWFLPHSADQQPRIAGRKRYPPRHPGATPQGALATISGRLRKQIENIKEMQRGRASDQKMVSTLCFLLPGKDGAQLRFESEVRLTNVTKEELGLVLWALTFGGGRAGAPCRHMLGRAKPFGAGQMRVEIADLRVVWNSRQAPEGFGRGRQEAAGFIAAFEEQLHEALGDDSRRQAWGDAVRALRATANPSDWHQDDKLNTMTLKEFQLLTKWIQSLRANKRESSTPIRIEFLPIN